MIPVFMEYRVKRALTESAEATAISDQKKKELADKITKRLNLKQGKDIGQKENTLSIRLDSNLIRAMVITECDQKWSLTIQKELEGQQIEFLFDSYQKVLIAFHSCCEDER